MPRGSSDQIFQIAVTSEYVSKFGLDLFSDLKNKASKKERRKEIKNTSVKYKLFGIAMPCGLIMMATITKHMLYVQVYTRQIKSRRFVHRDEWDVLRRWIAHANPCSDDADDTAVNKPLIMLPWLLVPQATHIVGYSRRSIADSDHWRQSLIRIVARDDCIIELRAKQFLVNSNS